MNWVNLILSAAISSIVIYGVISNFSGIKSNNKFRIIFIFLLLILIMISVTIFKDVYKLVFTMTSICICSYRFIFNRNLNKSIYYSFMYIISSSIVEIIISLILLSTSMYSMDKYISCEYSTLIFSILNCLLIYSLSKIHIIIEVIRKLENKLTNNRFTIFYLLITTFIVLLIIANNFINYEKNLNYYINFFMLVFIIMVSIIVLYHKITKDKIEKQYKEMMEYVSKYEQIINEQGKKNHEFNNQLMVLNGYIDNKKKLREYLNTIIEDHKGGKNYTIEQLSYFPDGGIKGLIYHKLSRMEEHEIRPYLYIAKDVKDIFETKFDINTYSDITKLFGVFLDNAIEASKDANKKEIEIDMKIDDKYLIVTISNTYSKDVDINKIGKKGFTTKGVGHGYGLSLVKDISKKNSKIETFNDVSNDMFKQTILIDLK